MNIFGEISFLDSLPAEPLVDLHCAKARVRYQVVPEYSLISSLAEKRWPTYISKSNYIGSPSYLEHPVGCASFYCIHNDLRLFASINKAVFLQSNLIVESLGSSRTYKQILSRWPGIIGIRVFVSEDGDSHFFRAVSHRHEELVQHVSAPTGDDPRRILLFSTTQDDKNVHHFIFECIPRLMPFIRQPRNALKLFFCYPPSPFQLEFLSLLGIEFDCIFLSSPADVVFEEAIFASYPDPSFGHKPYLDSLKATVLPRVPFVQNSPRKILVHRADSSNRSISNRNELIDYYVSKGFFPIMMSQFRAVEQISFFSHADEIVFEGGAAGAFLAFCRPGTVVTEISPPPSYFGSFNGISPIHWLLSLTAELHYEYSLLDFVNGQLIFRKP